jgi:hypothetical protein
MSAALIRGRCQKHGDCALFEVAEADATHAVVEVKKRGWPESRRVSWSIADAERAGLIPREIAIDPRAPSPRRPGPLPR